MSKPATRRLTNINFEQEGAHVALVGKHQGGPANGITTLVTKATDQIEQTVVDKATEVTVTLPFPEFLRRFFCMYWEDAEVLSMALGYGSSEDSEVVDSYQDYLDAKVANINILKSVYTAVDVEKALSELAPALMLELLQTQQEVEKAMSSALPVGESLEDKPSDNGVTMDHILKSAHEEIVAKSVKDAVEAVQKALDEQAVVLKAAQDQLEVFKQAADAAKVEVRKSALAAQVPAEKVEALLKAYSALDDEAFAVALDMHTVQKAATDASDMMTETGLNGIGEQDQSKVDKVAEILKSKYPTKKLETK
jgi:hypothetical protein